MEILLKLLNNRDHPEKWVLLLKNIIIYLNKPFQKIKTGTKYFRTKLFSLKFYGSCSTIATTQKNEFYCFKISFFLSQQSISDNKNKDKIISDKHFLTD